MTPVAVYLWSAGFDPDCRAIVLPPTVVREVPPQTEVVTPYGAKYLHEVERTVPPSVPDLATTCPKCKGIGCACADCMPGSRWPYCCKCERCGGSGRVLRVFHAVEQWRLNHESVDEPTPWFDPVTHPAEELVKANAEQHGHVERRLAVIGWSTLTTEPLPVVDEQPHNWVENHMLYAKHYGVTPDGPVFYSYEPDGWDWMHRRCDEPWAADLVPGSVVLLLDPPTMLDTPITEMVCDCGGDAPYVVNCPACGSCGTRPLALSAGSLSVVELAQ